MAKIYDNSPEPDIAVLVGVGVNETVTEGDLDELAALCESCNIAAKARVIQNRKDIDVTYYIGSGKVDEIKSLMDEMNPHPNVVVFDSELSGSKVRNLEKALGCAVLDRSKVILDIFAMRAQSAEGKLQVELAQLKYNLPRLVGSGGLLAKMRNSVGMRGPGEKKLELDKRTIRDQIHELEQKLAKLGANRTLNRREAVRGGKPRVCIIGYTNSGKSTLHNTIAKSAAAAEDKLFATLDPKTTNVYIDGVQILLTDTVGFINKLPHEFIKAFESTLDETRGADLLLHIADISNPDYPKQIEVVNAVIEKIGAGGVPVLTVFNKIDKIKPIKEEDGVIGKIEPYIKGGVEKNKGCVYVSALKNIGIDLLKNKIKHILFA